MAFSFGNQGNTMPGSTAGGGGLNQGPELEVIQTEALGFKSIAGDAKLRLTSAWSPPPADTASLMSIAPRRGLVAAAGPDGITIASTESVRKGFEREKEGDADVRAFEPQGKLPMPMRVSQLAFTADENYLILSAESGGGLAVYEVQTLLQGGTKAAFELATNGETLRALIPNPTIEKAELCAIVTDNGNLHIANLKERQTSTSLKTQVSCVSWSTKGKQLVAGLADGTIFQMTPEGEAKGEIPRPPNVANAHVSSLSWLENHLFLAIHTSTSESPPTSVYHLVTRKLPSDFTFQKLTDPVDPFGAEKTPHHTILRLKDFPPNLQDLLIVASTASPDIGLLSRAKSPLTADHPVDTAGVFTTTELADDSKRASLPMNDSFENTVPIGAALDLSSKDKVYKPLPADEEIEDSPGPLPGLWVLNHEGVLSSWWIVYEESIRQGTTYPGMAALDTSASPAAAASTASTAAPAATPAPSNSAFGAPSSTTAFGSTSSLGSAQKPSPFSTSGSKIPTFGGSSTLGTKASPWGSATNAPAASSGTTFGSGAFGGSSATSGSAFGRPSAPKSAFGGGGTFGSPSASSSAPAFGQPSSIGFGQSSTLGQKSSPWATGGTSGSNAAALPAFGQSSFASLGSSATKSPFGGASDSTPNAAPASGGFASFATSGGFASLGNKTSEGGSVFANKPSSSPFGSGALPSTISKDTVFPPPSSSGPATSNPFSQPFKLGTTFKADPSATDDGGKPSTPGASGSSLFGDNFGSALGDAEKKTPPRDQGMDITEETPKAKSIFSLGESTTPTTTPAPSKFGFSSATPSTSAPKPGLFGFPPQPATGGLFGSAKPVEKTPDIKVESEHKSLGDAPLPPESTSKNEYPLGESSSSSGTGNVPSDGGSKASPKADSAPLPADFLSTPKATITKETAPAPPPSDFLNSQKRTSPVNEAPLPPDFLTPKPGKSAESTTPFEALPLPADDLASSAEPELENLKSTAPATAPDFLKMPKQSLSSATWSSTPQSVTPAVDDAPLPPDFMSKPRERDLSTIPTIPENEHDSDLQEDEDEDEDEEENDGSEGSGVMVSKDLSPSMTAMTPTAGMTPQSSFGGVSSSTYSIPRTEEERPRASLFGDLSRNAPMFPRPSQTSPRSPSPVRGGAVPGRMLRQESARSVSAPGMASQILAAQKKQPSQIGSSIIGNKPVEDHFISQQRLARQKRQAEETKTLEDEEDDEIQKILASKIEPSLKLDDFIAHSNVVPSAKETIPAQVEAVYRDINSMIDTLGLNARSLASFLMGHDIGFKAGGRRKEDLEDPESWVLSEIDELREVIDRSLAQELEGGRVHDVEEKLEACNELAREMSRLRSKQDDLRKIIMVKADPEQADLSRTLPLSTEQASQQNELRREYANFTKLLAEAEEALTILKTRIAAASSASGKGKSNMPTVEAVLRTISKMTSMVEKRSGDIDVLENQMRKLRFSSVNSREGSPMVTPQRNSRSVMFSPERSALASPGTLRNSFVSSVASYGGRGTPPRKKLSGFSQEEKSDLMAKRARRQAVLNKLKGNVERTGVSVWAFEDME
ncbi:Nuclear pore complex subunit [Colletotrichum higginsianum IMI 349063]|uniref:Nuclear pore complex subunit n=3 Tax=Colletotrichum higginsianum (strain IMI 349063) TaxID=759273 RepID=A0A1B7YT80_COLHI|nr:Nuclear pore complex subunit [Colletotrichum higginsianum IMI 349063]OBR15250.1 Nuclear pore complex subunit [Colletotrichum higginsianum IMI 349063]